MTQRHAQIVKEPHTSQPSASRSDARAQREIVACFESQKEKSDAGIICSQIFRREGTSIASSAIRPSKPPRDARSSYLKAGSTAPTIANGGGDILLANSYSGALAAPLSARTRSQAGRDETPLCQSRIVFPPVSKGQHLDRQQLLSSRCYPRATSPPGTMKIGDDHPQPLVILA